MSFKRTYMVPHKLNNDTVYLHVLAGFGNRLRALVSGICLAEDLNKKLVIIWKPNYSCKISLPECFDMKTLPYTYNQTMPTENFMNVTNESDIPSSLLTIESYSAFYKAYTPKWYEVLRRIKFNKTINIEPLLEILNDNFIGIHIRRTDNSKSILSSPNNYFLETMKKEVETNPQAQFYLATDCQETKEIILKNFKDRIITHKFVLNRHTKEGMVNSLTDFLSLSLCSKILGSVHSSYSEMAAAYGNKVLVLP